jgi:hypothetical protein
MAGHDLTTFGRVVGALYAEALDAIAETNDTVLHKAWHRVAHGLRSAVLAADPSQFCPVCGELADLVACQWCSAETCANEQCQRDAHVGERECPHTPQPAAPVWVGPEDPDIAY